MHFRSRFFLLFAVASFACGASAAGEDPGQRFLNSLHPVPNLGRQAHAAVVLREFKAEGLIPFKPQRIDYTDYYPLLKPVRILGHDLVIVEEEYMTESIGCCVSKGAGLVVRLRGDLRRLEAFAGANKCRIEAFADASGYRKDSHVRFVLPAGAYASMSCRARDELP